MSYINGAVVVTTISSPNNVLHAIADQCAKLDMQFYVIGDTKSPVDFELDGCRYFSIDAQKREGLAFADLCPTRHYARKNIGYLLAMRNRIDYIVETDDDNMPSADFYLPLPREMCVPVLKDVGWVNMYRYFTDNMIWPRGLPLDKIRDAVPGLPSATTVSAPIQQGLANDNPDVDAIYRLVMPLPFSFEKEARIAIGENAWCPFNSQNTIYYREAFPLMYLPAFCSFRMTDIWRSFVAQRIAWENNWVVLFREATVRQFRNDHSLVKDFEDEISGYLGNDKIREVLQSLSIDAGVENIPKAMRTCYEALVHGGFIGANELPLLDAYLQDIASINEEMAG